MENESKPTKEKKYSNWFLAGYYFRKLVAWFLGCFGIFFSLDEDAIGGAIMLFSAIYLLVHTKKE